MDERTRFMLVSRIAETREKQDAIKTFHKSKEVSSKNLGLIVTDGLPGYHLPLTLSLGIITGQ